MLPQALLDWLNGWVYALLGAEALVLVQRHPWIHVAIAALAAGLLLASVWCVRATLRGVGRRWHGLQVQLALQSTAAGRRALRLERSIRRRGRHLYATSPSAIPDRAEQRELAGLLDGFLELALPTALQQAHILIARSDDRLAERLSNELTALTEQWSAAEDAKQRDRLQPRIAQLRHQSAKAGLANSQRDQLLRNLEEADSALDALESQLVGLHHERDRALPSFRGKLLRLAEEAGRLRAAYRELGSLPDDDPHDGP